MHRLVREVNQLRRALDERERALEECLGASSELEPNATRVVAVTPRQLAETSGSFRVDSGPCAANNSCFYSPHYPSNYGVLEECSITAQVRLLQAQPFG